MLDSSATRSRLPHSYKDHFDLEIDISQITQSFSRLTYPGKMGNSSSKQSGEKAQKAQAKKNLKAAERLNRDRHNHNGFLHREPNFESIRSKTIGKAQAQHGLKISAPMPGNFPEIQPPPAVYHHRVSDRRPPTPPPMRKVRERFARPYSIVDAVPAPLTIRKLPQYVPSAGQPYQPPTFTSEPTGSASRQGSAGPSQTPPPPPIPSRSTRRPLPQSPERQPQPSSSRQQQPPSSRRERVRSPQRQPQPPSSRRHGPSTARNPPPSGRAPPPPSGRNFTPRGESSRVEAPVRSGRRRVTREEIRRRE